MPTERRSEFIIVNIARMPLWGSPISQPVASSNDIWHVAEPWMPILRSQRGAGDAVARTGLPSSVGKKLRHHEHRDAFHALRRISIRASTRWTMFSVRS